MQKDLITKELTFSSYLILLFLIWIIVAVATLPLVTYWQGAYWQLFLLPLIFVGAWYLTYRNKQKLKRRDTQVAVFTARHHFKLEPLKPGLLATLGAIDDIPNVRDRRVRNVVQGSGWLYYDFSYNLYSRTKSGEFKSAVIYYSVMSVKLPRKLPNVFFDSIKARRRQFRFHFARSQRHSLEGDFDQHFVTYFPEGYTIDAMSFISPDVMWKLREASDYDIEIVGDQLFLYGPLYEPEMQISDMAAKILAIKKELLGNILTYRDDRLPYSQGRQTVAAVGASLKVNKLWAIVGSIIVVLYCLLRIVVEIF